MKGVELYGRVRHAVRIEGPRRVPIPSICLFGSGASRVPPEPGRSGNSPAASPHHRPRVRLRSSWPGPGLLVPSFLRFNSTRARWIDIPRARRRSPARPGSQTAPSARRRASWRPCRPVPRPPPKVVPFLGIEACRDAGAINQIAEHHRHTPTLSGGFRNRRGNRRRRVRRGSEAGAAAAEVLPCSAMARRGLRR